MKIYEEIAGKITTEMMKRREGLDPDEDLTLPMLVELRAIVLRAVTEGYERMVEEGTTLEELMTTMVSEKGNLETDAHALAFLLKKQGEKN